MRLTKLIPLSLIALLIASFLPYIPVQAETAPVVSQGLAVSPPTFNLSANPGDTVTHTIRIDNLSNQSATVTPVVENFTAAGEQGEVNITTSNEPFALSTWVTVSPTQATIAPKSSQTFSFTTIVPGDAEPGGRFGAIVFKTAPGTVTGSGVAISQEISSLVLLRVAGDAKEKASIAQFSAGTPSIEQGPVNFVLRVKNEGNVHVRPVGTITIADVFGHKVATIPVDGKNILPSAIRELNATYNEKSLFGRYTATVSLVYGSKQQTVTATTAFFVIPWKMLTIVLVIVLIIAGLLYVGRRRLMRSLKVLFGKGDA